MGNEGETQPIECAGYQGNLKRSGRETLLSSQGRVHNVALSHRVHENRTLVKGVISLKSWRKKTGCCGRFIDRSYAYQYLRSYWLALPFYRQVEVKCPDLPQ